MLMYFLTVLFLFEGMAGDKWFFSVVADQYKNQTVYSDFYLQLHCTHPVSQIETSQQSCVELVMKSYKMSELMVVYEQ